MKISGEGSLVLQRQLGRSRVLQRLTQNARWGLPTNFNQHSQLGTGEAPLAPGVTPDMIQPALATQHGRNAPDTWLAAHG